MEKAGEKVRVHFTGSSTASDDLVWRHVHHQNQVAAEKDDSVAQRPFAAVYGEGKLLA